MSDDDATSAYDKMVAALTAKELRDAIKHAQMSTFLNPTPKGPHHGKHWRTSPKAHRDPAQGADPNVTLRTRLPTGWTIPSSAAFGPPAPTPSNIPYAGVRTGEITAYRAWRAASDPWENIYSLYSLVADHAWTPGGVETGDINMVVGESIYEKLYGGIYAFKHINTPDLIYCTMHSDKYVLGTVALWGEVVEHEHGYRAQFARITDFIWHHEKHNYIIYLYRKEFR